MNDQLPALLLLMFAMMMFGAFEYYNVPWAYQIVGVFMVCGIPVIIMVISAMWERKKKVVTKND